MIVKNNGDSAFQCSYVFGRKIRSNDDEKVVKPILEIRDIDTSVSKKSTRLNTKLLKLTSWIVISLFSVEMAIQECNQLSTLKI